MHPLDAPDFQSGWFVTLGAKPAWHIAAHHANFSAAFSASAICRMQLLLRCCGSGVRGAECRAFFGVAGFALK